jgi:hypothetical protein
LRQKASTDSRQLRATARARGAANWPAVSSRNRVRARGEASTARREEVGKMRRAAAEMA